MEKNTIYFDRNAKDIWAMARLHHIMLNHIQNHPLWEPEEIPDIPLTEDQMIAFVKGYDPDWDCRYAPFLLGGWLYITRSGHWLKKFKYQKGPDYFYHITEHYTTEKGKGQNLLAQVLIEGHFGDEMRDDRLRNLLRNIEILPPNK